MAQSSAFRVIVAGTDGSPLAERALAHAVRIAAQDGARLHIVTAFPDSWPLRERFSSSARTESIDLRRVAEDVLARAADHASEQSVEADVQAIEGDAADALISVAESVGADLIVLGGRGLSTIARFALGSVSQKVVHHAPCTVMIVRAPG